MGLRELGLAAIILGTAGCTQPQETRVERHTFNHYLRGLSLETLAERQTDEKARTTLFADALQEFKLAEHDKPIESELKQAYCLSQLGETSKAIDLADTVVKQEPSNLAFYVRGLIKQHKGWHAMAIRDFDKSIDIKDAALVRLARYNSYMAFSVKVDEIIVDGVQKALDDIDKYVEMKKEEPDGHIYRYVTIGVLAYANQDKEKVKEAYQSLETAIKLIDRGNPIVHRELQQAEDLLRDVYSKLQKELEPKQKKEYH